MEMEMVDDGRETMARNPRTNWRRSRHRDPPASPGRYHLGPAPLLAAFFLLLLAAPGHAAEFTRTFSGLTKAADLALEWDGVDARYMPLTIHAVVVNRTGDENRANVFRRDLAVGINGTAWVWKNMPSPLPYLATGQYQVEIRTEAQTNATAGSVPPVLPKSPYFPILEVRNVQPTGSHGGATSPSRASDGGGSGGPSSKTISLAVGIVVTLVVLLLAGTGCLCWRRRHMRAKRAKKRENKFAVVIH